MTYQADTTLPFYYYSGYSGYCILINIPCYGLSSVWHKKHDYYKNTKKNAFCDACEKVLVYYFSLSRLKKLHSFFSSLARFGRKAKKSKICTKWTHILVGRYIHEGAFSFNASPFIFAHIKKF